MKNSKSTNGQLRKTSIKLINLRMELTEILVEDYAKRGGKVSGCIKSNILKYVYSLLPITN